MKHPPIELHPPLSLAIHGPTSTMPRHAHVPGLGLNVILRPEFYLTLFVFSGVFKSHPWITNLPTDWSVLFGLIALGAATASVFVTTKLPNIKLIQADLYMGMLTLTMMFSLLYTTESAYGLNIFLDFTLFGLMATYAFPRFIVRDPKVFLRTVLKTIVGLALISLLFFDLGFGVSDRALSSSYLLWAYFMGIASIASFGLCSLCSKLFGRAIYMGLSILFALHIVFAEARGPLIALFGVIMFFVLFRLKPSWKLLSITGIGLIGIVLTSSLPGEQLSRYERLLSGNLHEARGLQLRIDAYTAGIDIWREYPIFGVGLGGYSAEVTDEIAHLRYPHNRFIQFAAESGLVGFGLFLLFILSMWRAYRKASSYIATRNNMVLLHICFALALFGLGESMFSGDYPNRIEMYLYGLLIIACAYLPFRQSQRATCSDL